MSMTNRTEASKKSVDDTIKHYSNLLSRPLPEKQLVRPTFKFIQDLVKSLIIETRILRDVFNPSDFETGKRVWDKQMKTDFIQRLIDHAAKNGQPVVGCVAAKVVAGLEPNKTNELLQALARLAQVRLSAQQSSGNRPRTFTRAQATAATTTAKNTTPQRPGNANQNSSKKSSVTSNRSRTEVVDVSQSQRVSIVGNNLSQRTSAKSSRSSSLVSSNKPESSAANNLSSKSSQIERESSPRVGSTIGSNYSAKRQEKTLTTNDETSEMSSSEVQTNKPKTRDIAQYQRVMIISSESDISKHIPQLKINLKQLRITLNSINQLNAQLGLIFNQTTTV